MEKRTWKTFMKDRFILSGILSGTKNSSPKFLKVVLRGKTTALLNQCTLKVTWRDIRPSMVTHTRFFCSAFDPSKVHTHTTVNTHTHTPWTHTRSSGQPFMLRRPGSSWGSGVLLKGTSVVVLQVERALYIHSLHLQFLPARDSNSQPFNYESNSLTIRPRLPPQGKRMWNKNSNKRTKHFSQDSGMNVTA